MQELSLNVLDLVQNSIKAKASMINIEIVKNTKEKTYIIAIEDNGCGMDENTVKMVTDPFYTTRTTRKVGLGIPFFKMAAEMTGGSFSIESKLSIGTKLRAFFNYEHIDMLPVGDMASTMLSLISVNPNIDFIYSCSVDEKAFVMDTREIKKILEGMPINSMDVLSFIKDYINENQTAITT